MIRITKKYNLSLTAMRLAPHLQAQLPAWYHPSTKTRSMHNPKTKCLIQNHKARSIADLLKMSARIRIPTHPHQHEPNPWCPCHDCTQDRLNIRCKNPNKCATESLERIKSIFPKMNPLHTTTWHGNLSLTNN